MTYQIYSQQQLQLKSIARLKQIYTQIGASVEVIDKRCKDAWISAIASRFPLAFALRVPEAIAEYQSSKVHKLTPAAPDNQALSQAELDHHIATQAQTVAPETLTPVEISFYDHEYYAGDKLIASITYDDDLTQPWVVMVNNKEVHRAATVMLCHRYISTHYKDGSLPVQEQNATDTNSTTENRIMAHIFNECQNYGFALLDDGIYHNDVKLGSVGCTDGNWWVKRGSSDQQQYCNSVMDAVRTLSMVDTLPHVELADYEELLDRPFEMLTNDEWELLRESAAA